MIKVQELRIGNYVYCQDEINVIYGITKEGFIQYEKENSVYYCGIDEIKPIELTEEILLKNTKTSRFISRYKSELIFDNYDSNICIFKQKLIQICLYCDFRKKIYYIKINGKKIHIKYLHQLQNLYFVLIGQELEIQL